MTDPHRLDLNRLGAWIERTLGLSGAIAAEKFAGGQSNPTYAVSLDGEVRFVLRKKPPGNLLPSAHAVEREFRVTDALKDSDVPVARPLALCEDASVVGTPFFLMNHVAGRNFWDARLPDMAPQERAAIYDEMNRVLGLLHRVDPVAAGLGDYGRPGDYFGRQAARWTKQYRASQTDDIPAMDQLIDWLPAHNPARTASRIVHGDYRNDNLIFATERPEIRAVLDWELSTLGDPLADLAQHVMAWRVPHAGYRGLADSDLTALGLPDEAAYVARYWERAGGTPPTRKEWRYALALAMFRNAAIRQGVYKRAMDGNASSDQAKMHGVRAAEIAGLGWRIARGEDDARLI